jgi:predicted MPP superfamily phosphohydrolase
LPASTRWPILPRLSIRLTLTLLFVVSNLGLVGLEIHLLRRRQPWPRALGAALLAWAFLMVGLLVVQAFGPISWHPFLREWLYLPLSVEMVWNLLLSQLLFLGAILITLILGRARKVDRVVPMSPHDISRRRFIYLATCGAAPAAAIAMGVHGTLTRHDLRVRNFDLALPDLPPGMEGFTIAHVSDLHCGVFCGPDRLRLISDATNDMGADLVVITGDIINSSMSEFHDAVACINRMKSRHGIYLCEGNHDLIPGPSVFRHACAAIKLPILWNSNMIVPVNGARLVIGGLPWVGGSPVSPGTVEKLYPKREPNDLRLLLAHHPNSFDAAQSADLILTGHTHGGQLMVGSVGFGPLLFKYWSGLYRHPSNAMIVSNGAGDWFPCRIGAPAEIGRLRLTRAS